MRHLLVLLFLGATGCHLPATLDAQPHRSTSAERYGSRSAGESLRAHVWFDEYNGRASFDLNRPAHVAIFALRPLGKIEMIYPGWGWGVGERAFHRGRHSVRTESHMYHLVGGRSGHRHSGYGRSGQTYILLIASERPLDLDRFLATGTLPWLNHPSVTWNPFLATDHLAREIVQGHGRSEWTAAYHVVWPDAELRRYDGRIPYTRVRCPGGVVMSIPTQVIRAGGWSCPDRDARPPETARPAAPRVPPITGALPKRPRPTDWRGPTPTRGADQGEERIRPARPDRTGKPATRVRPAARPAPNAEAAPTSRPAPKVVPRPSAGPKARPRPKPRPKPKPKAKPKPNDGV